VEGGSGCRALALGDYGDNSPPKSRDFNVLAVLLGPCLLAVTITRMETPGQREFDGLGYHMDAKCTLLAY